MEYFVSFFEISLNTINLFSIMIGIIFGLSTSAFNRYRSWWIVVGYLGMLAGWYAIKAGALKPWGIG
jgi:hypothetical protein